MSYCCDKLFFIIIRALVALNQAIVMSPFIYFKNSKARFFTKNFPSNLTVTWRFRTHRFVTAMSLFLIIFYAAVAPVAVKVSTDLYSLTRRHQDNLFILVAKFTMATVVSSALLIVATHIWQRENIVKILNLFNEILLRTQQLQKPIVDAKILLALLFKMVLTIYDLLLNLPFLFTAASRLTTPSVVAYLFTHYLQGLGAVFELNIFTFLLLFLICYHQLEKELDASRPLTIDLKLCELINLQDSLYQLVVLFRNTFQFGIFLIILLYFVTILCNIYAMLDFYVATGHFYSTFVIYLVSQIAGLYSMIFVFYLCERRQRRVKELFLLREELYFLKPPAPLAAVEADVLWPQSSEF